jgi:hypothetical protein
LVVKENNQRKPEKSFLKLQLLISKIKRQESTRVEWKAQMRPPFYEFKVKRADMHMMIFKAA